MRLQDHLCQQGDTLFRLRSYVPLLLLGLMVLAMWRHPSQPVPAAWIWACVLISLSGQLIRADVVGHTPDGTSGRNTSVQVAKRLNTVGWYSVVRHPLYVGNALMWLGLALLPGIWWLALLVMAGFAFFYERIMLREEQFIHGEFGPDFEQWAARTPAFLPRLSQWKAWELSWSWKNVLRREFSGFFALVGLFILLLALGEAFDGRPLHLSRLQQGLVMAALATYLLLFTLRRFTRLLHERPR